VAYGTAIGYTASGGFGLIGLTLDFISPDSLDQELKIREIEDPYQWVWDRTYKEVDARDMAWAIGRQKYSHAEFKRAFPGKEIVDASFYKEDDTYADWGDGKNVWVAEYWKLDYKKRKIARFTDGSSGPVDAPENNGKKVVRRSVAEREYPYPCQYLISGIEVLDKTPWPGKRIPIYPVYGTKYYVDGKLVVKSVIADSLTSQKSYNFNKSLELEALSLAPKPKWVLAAEQISGQEQAWKTANTSTDAALFYNGMSDSTGKALPPPKWEVFQPDIQSFSISAQQAKDDIRATSLSQTALGEFDTRRQSGKAVEALQGAAGQGQIHYSESLSQALKALYLDIIEIDPKLNRGAKTLRYIKPDGKHDMARVNDPAAQKPLMLGDGRYDVIVSTGPSQDSQREAASDFIDTVAQHDPEGFALIRDIAAQIKKPVLGHYADEIAKRWTPPQFQQQDPNQPPLPPQVQQQLALVPQLTQQLHQLSAVIEQKQVEEQGKFQREMAVEQQRFKTAELNGSIQIRVAEINALKDQYATEVDARVKELESRIDGSTKTTIQQHKQAHEHGMQQMEHQHASDMADKQAATASMQSAQDADQQQAAVENAPTESAQ
jgi:hypothetical protein